MSTSYGSATVQFPGFKPVQSGTTDGALDISYRRRSRSFKFADGTRRRLSKKERSRLLTMSRKWHYQDKGRMGYPFNTFSREHYC